MKTRLAPAADESATRGVSPLSPWQGLRPLALALQKFLRGQVFPRTPRVATQRHPLYTAPPLRRRRRLNGRLRRRRLDGLGRF